MESVENFNNRETPRKLWDPSRKLLKSIRHYQQYKNQKGVIALLLSKTATVRFLFWSIITGADIPITTRIGKGLLIPHPNGIVIHPRAEIGDNCLIHQQVTIGVKRGNTNPPVIGEHVDIGAGAKIIGQIAIGNHALIGANSVVVKDVAPYAIVAGIPAKVIGSTHQ